MKFQPETARNEDILRRWVAGEDVQTIQAALDMSRAAVWGVIKRARAAGDRRAIKRHDRPDGTAKKRVLEALASDPNMTLAQAARVAQVTIGTAWAVASRAGISRPRAGVPLGRVPISLPAQVPAPYLAQRPAEARAKLEARRNTIAHMQRTRDLPPPTREEADALVAAWLARNTPTVGPSAPSYGDGANLGVGWKGGRGGASA